MFPASNETDCAIFPPVFVREHSRHGKSHTLKKCKYKYIYIYRYFKNRAKKSLQFLDKTKNGIFFWMTIKMVPDDIKIALFGTSGLPTVQKRDFFYVHGFHFIITDANFSAFWRRSWKREKKNINSQFFCTCMFIYGSSVYVKSKIREGGG